MISLETVHGGPLAGLPSFLIQVHDDRPLPTTDGLLRAITPYIPPIVHARLDFDPQTTYPLAEIADFIAEIRQLGLAIECNAFVEVEEWHKLCNWVTLFTSDVGVKSSANVIVIQSERPPSEWRPSPLQYAHPPLMYWSKSDGNDVTAEEVASLPVGMRLWHSADIAI
jgi:hypothetical protein